MQKTSLIAASVFLFLGLSAAGGQPATQPGRTYMAIPIIGQLGREVSAEAVAKALDAARQTHADYAVFLIDSEGGSVTEADRIVALVSHNPDVRTVALVKKAMGASVAVTFACRRTFLHPEGVVSLPIPREFNGQPMTDVQVDQLRMEISRRLIEACTVSRREPLLATGMVDPSLSLYVTDSVPPQVFPSERPSTQRIKGPGECLSFSKSNAVRDGYAEGICSTLGELARQMGLSDGWTSAGEQGRLIMQQRRDEARSQQAKEVYAREHEQEINQLIEKVKRQRQTLQALEQGLVQLDSQRKQLVRKAEDAYEQTNDAAARDAALAAIQQEYQTKRKDVLKAQQQTQTSLDADMQSLKEFQEKLK